MNRRAKPKGGTDDKGLPTDPRFDLVHDPWKSRFIAAGQNRDLQRVQIETALMAFGKSVRALQRSRRCLSISL